MPCAVAASLPTSHGRKCGEWLKAGVAQVPLEEIGIVSGLPLQEQPSMRTVYRGKQMMAYAHEYKVESGVFTGPKCGLFVSAVSVVMIVNSN